MVNLLHAENVPFVWGRCTGSWEAHQVLLRYKNDRSYERGHQGIDWSAARNVLRLYCLDKPAASS